MARQALPEVAPDRLAVLDEEDHGRLGEDQPLQLTSSATEDRDDGQGASTLGETDRQDQAPGRSEALARRLLTALGVAGAWLPLSWPTR